MSDDIKIKDGYVYGGWREPKNLWTNLTDSIHDDDVAKSVGMRGGTIPGTIHLSLFGPIALKVFGDQWFEKGTLSLYYTYATTDREKVRAIIALPPEEAEDVQVEAKIELIGGQTVAQGTISMGNPTELSYLKVIELKNSPPEDLRILAHLKPGLEMPSKEFLLTQKDAIKGLDWICDPLEYYKVQSPWGSPILSPTAMYGAMALGADWLDSHTIDAVPFYGATEIQLINGPVRVGVPYKVTGTIVCVGVSSKTEYFWYDSVLEDKESGKQIAKMRHLNRFMKASSPLYKEE
ncbi:MAG: hypothetical protein EAX89_14365 [Candidatus Lokiarchaeota archaeon]|nr:hypothetical protein [Candidatus Lokiarchaeota archaeon]